jgi:hypothetical protein
MGDVIDLCHHKDKYKILETVCKGCHHRCHLVLRMGQKLLGQSCHACGSTKLAGKVIGTGLTQEDLINGKTTT